MCELQKWLREEHNLHIHITRINQYSPIRKFAGWCLYIDGGLDRDLAYINDKYIFDEYLFKGYEEGLQEALKLI